MLLHFFFTQSIASTILYSLYQMAVLWLLYVCFIHLIKLTSYIKYWLSIIVQIFSFLFFIYSLFFSNSINGKSIINDWLLVNSNFLENEMLNSIVTYAYFTILCFLVLKFFYQFNKLKQLSQNNLLKIDAPLKLFVQQTALQLGVKKSVKVFISKNIKTPFTVGFLKPVILLPFTAVNYLSSEQMEIALLHELAHIKRADYFIQIILSAIEATLFFNPFVYYFKKEIERERENCCDDIVMQFKYNKLLYADTLLQLSYLQQLPSFALKIGGNKKYLLHRIERITNTVYKQKLKFPFLKILLVIITLLTANLFLSKKPDALQQQNSFSTAPAESVFHHFLFKPIAYNSIDNSTLKKSKRIKQITKKKKELKTADFRFNEPTIVYEDDLNRIFTNTVLIEDSIVQKRNLKKVKKDLIAVPAVSKINSDDNSIIQLTSINDNKQKDTLKASTKVYKILVKKAGKPDEEITIIIE